MYQQQQRYTKAVKAHQQAIDRAPDYAVAYANLAASYEALGKIKPALLAYEQALQRDASLEFVREKITVLRKQVGRQGMTAVWTAPQASPDSAIRLEPPPDSASHFLDIPACPAYLGPADGAHGGSSSLSGLLARPA